MAKKAQTATQEQINEDITVTSTQEAFDDIESMTPEELRAQLAAVRAQLANKPKRQAKAKLPAEVLSPEELAARQEAIDAAQAEVDRLAAELNEAKAKLNQLKPRSLSVVRRGPVGVGAFVKDLIKEGLTNEEILERVAAQFPDNHTNVNCINWYRNALKQWPDGKRPSKKVVSQESTDDSSTDDSSTDAAAA